MTIPIAKFIKAGRSQIISPNEIKSKQDYINSYKGFLFCAGESDCLAKIELVSKDRKKFFRTWKNSVHADNCKYRFDREKTKSPQSYGESVKVTLSLKHTKSILYTLANKYKGIKITVNTGKSKDTVIDKRKPTIKGNRTIPSVETSAETLRPGMREPRVTQRRCDEIIPDDYGKTLGVYGDVKLAVISESSVKLLYDTNSSQIVSLFFYTPYKERNGQDAFNLVVKIGELINEKKLIVVGCCVGLVQKAENEIQVQVMEESDIQFNQQTPFRFYINENK